MSEQYNLYLVVSEEAIFWLDYEPYRIADLVVARSHDQAKWLAWNKAEHGQASLTAIYNMPKMAVRLKEEYVPGPPRVATDEFEPDRSGSVSRHLEWLWYLGNAPHIGIKEEP